MGHFAIKPCSHGAAAMQAGAAAGLIAQVAAPAPIVTEELMRFGRARVDQASTIISSEK